MTNANVRVVQVALFASGGGTNAEAIIHRSFRIDSAYRVALMVSNNSQCLAMQRAAMFGIPTVHISSATHPNEAAYNHALMETLRSHSIDIIALAGYMKKMPNGVIEQFEAGRIFNIHPALLPKFGGQGMYGMNVHRAVLEAGERESGLTIHEVTADYDAGAIIKQHVVDVLPTDTAESLAHRINTWEVQVYPDVLQEICADIIKSDTIKSDKK